jgi:hypothetical protein
MRFPGFVGPSYQSQSRSTDTERLVNWFLESNESAGAKTPACLLPVPGLRTFVLNFTQSPVRGQFEQDGRCFAVIGVTFYEIFENGTATARGTVVYDDNPATISCSGDASSELFITSGGHGYRYDLITNALTEVLTNAKIGAYLDGFFLAMTDDSVLQISGLADAATWDPTQIAQRLAGADRWQAMAVTHREIWLFGSQSTEVWYNAGSFPFPFAPIPGAFFEWGIGAAFSVQRVDGALTWLAQNDRGSRVIVRANGYAPVRISTHAVEYAISQYSRVDDAYAFSYQDQGHTFYVLTFPSADATWCYDAATGLWHERLAWDHLHGVFRAWRPRTHCFAFGKHLVGDRETGNILEMSTELATEANGVFGMRRVRRAPHLSNEGGWIFYDRLQVEMDTGVGLINGDPVTGDGLDPQVMLRVSRDGGRTFGPERWVSAGKQGQYRTRVEWRRLGRARDAVFELVVSDPVPWRITDAYLTLGAE